MPYCPRCGVELDSYIKQCPLCSFPIPDVGAPEQEQQSKDLFLLNRYNLNKAERRRRWLEAKPFIFTAVLFTLVFLSIVSGFLDLYFFNKFSWSRYVIAVNITAAAVLFFLMGIIRSFIFNLLGTSLAITGFLYLIDSFNNEITWFWNLGLIICFNFILWTLILRIIIIHSRRKGLNIASYSIFSVSFACLSIDLVNNLMIDQAVRLSWAVAVISALVPVGVLLLLLHVLLSPAVKNRLKRKFHI